MTVVFKTLLANNPCRFKNIRIHYNNSDHNFSGYIYLVRNNANIRYSIPAFRTLRRGS